MSCICDVTGVGERYSLMNECYESSSMSFFLSRFTIV